MDERIIQTLENLIYEKIILYNDLLHCLEKERETLIKKSRYNEVMKLAALLNHSIK